MILSLEYVRAYIDDLLVITSASYADHLEKLGEVLSRLRNAGLKVNAKKSYFAKPELEYLARLLGDPKRYQPNYNQSFNAIANIAVPTTKKELRAFIRMVNYYRDMWI
jgi:hypothetical protein